MVEDATVYPSTNPLNISHLINKNLFIVKEALGTKFFHTIPVVCTINENPFAKSIYVKMLMYITTI